ncbi:MAG: cysteine--1-D-myo-inosityl 2-amino-2-deoxy-alpha-D-glucopyranoside ligase [Archangiaceae bacterium]|nr:cysteine--1-D-myo-inosityl 2-amino-2-deoxy-alpha-D-glucopyranoside ligase [Archangiaceae bacterium]
MAVSPAAPTVDPSAFKAERLDIPHLDAWAAPVIPDLPGKAPPLVMFDSARGDLYATREQRPAGSREVSMYVCGITPYDATHLGHAATMVTFDLVNRFFRDQNLTVHYTQNVTDIDDPLLRRANRDNVDWVQLGKQETQRYRGDMEALNVLPPEHYVGAVDAIPYIVEDVTQLLDEGIAYRIDDGTGDVYFDVTKTKGFGKVSNMDLEQMVREAADHGGDPERPGKKSPVDPLLWRTRREGEPSWPGGKLGEGRPGWHIECSVIAKALLGAHIDLQGGGSDLRFPHHECSTAHSEALSGQDVPFAEHYVHTSMIGLNGQKMSKRTGNLVFFSELRKENVDPMAVRLSLLAGHYRKPRDWSDALLKTGEQRLARWREAAQVGQGPSGAALLKDMRRALAADLDSPAALARVDAWAEAALKGEGTDEKAPALMRDAVEALLGITL